MALTSRAVPVHHQPAFDPTLLGTAGISACGPSTLLSTSGTAALSPSPRPGLVGEVSAAGDSGDDPGCGVPSTALRSARKLSNAGKGRSGDQPERSAA